jgi:hypothetical protein
MLDIEGIQNLAKILDLQWETVLAFIPLIVGINAILKGEFGVSGKWNYLSIFLISLTLNGLAYMPLIRPTVSSTLFCALAAAGGWMATKQQLHKIGTPPTQPNGGSK